MVNCRTIPSRMGTGVIRTFRKSLPLKVVPTPKVMIWMSGTMRILRSVPNQLRKTAGRSIETATNTSTQRVKLYLA